MSTAKLLKQGGATDEYVLYVRGDQQLAVTSILACSQLTQILQTRCQRLLGPERIHIPEICQLASSVLRETMSAYSHKHLTPNIFDLAKQR